jgi:hypothetical protein
MEDIRTIDQVLAGVDWQRGLCPDRCPVSPRNADYSFCNHPDNHGECVRGCRVGVGGLSLYSYWCEASVVGGVCPLRFTR